MKEHLPPWLLILLLAAAFGSPAFTGKPAAVPPQERQRPNILFCIADDWSGDHAGAYGDKAVRTPIFDRVAREGVLFTQAYCAAPSCTPSRAALLTGRMPHQLEAGSNLWGFLPVKYPNFVGLLEENGYCVGLTRKGWGPGNFEAGGYARNPAGPGFKDFAAFLAGAPKDKPFCFWFGSSDPHRPYQPGSGANAGTDLSAKRVPPHLPDVPEIRADIADYYFEVERFDREVGQMLDKLRETGQLENTIVVVTSDNGMPFPRAKANLYDIGTRMPLAVRWGKHIKGGRTVTDFVSLIDLAPTFLEAAGLKPPKEMTGQSLLPLLTGKGKFPKRDAVFTERERHANVRKGDLSYPARAVRTADFLYIRNYRPDRWPAGDPQLYFAVGPYGDVDDSPTKQFLLSHQHDSGMASYFELSFARRPAEELYDLRTDPGQVKNVAGKPEYETPLAALRQRLDGWMKQTDDPRLRDTDVFDTYPYFGKAAEAENK